MVNPFFALLIGLTAVVLLSLLFWPDKGFYWRWQQNRRLSQRVLMEDALKTIHKQEMHGRQPNLAEIAGTLHVNQNQAANLMVEMEMEGLLTMQDGRPQLTPSGQKAALHIIRAHRLWEHHLAEETGYEEAEWHGRAEQIEHTLSPQELDQLAQRLNNPTHDPHGDPIPTAQGELKGHGGRPLTNLPPNTPARIVHLEDEPEIVYAQLVAEGLHPGLIVRVVEASPTRIRFWANGDEHWLAPLIAANISVVEEATAVTPEPNLQDCCQLSSLEPGDTAEVVSLSPALRRVERRRLMDLGILSGTLITAEYRSPGGDPVAYQIRGATIALRKEQSKLIKVRKVHD